VTSFVSSTVAFRVGYRYESSLMEVGTINWLGKISVCQHILFLKSCNGFQLNLVWVFTQANNSIFLSTHKRIVYTLQEP
jgi:hypothetical protein